MVAGGGRALNSGHLSTHASRYHYALYLDGCKVGPFVGDPLAAIRKAEQAVDADQEAVIVVQSAETADLSADELAARPFVTPAEVQVQQATADKDRRRGPRATGSGGKPGLEPAAGRDAEASTRADTGVLAPVSSRPEITRGLRLVQAGNIVGGMQVADVIPFPGGEFSRRVGT